MTRLEQLAEEWANQTGWLSDTIEWKHERDAHLAGLRAGIELAAKLVQDEFTHAVTARTPEDAWVTEGRGVVRAIRKLAEEGKA